MYLHHGFLVASAKTAARILRCAIAGFRFPRRLVAAIGLGLVTFALWSVPASAQVEGPCTITVSTGGRTSDVNSHSTPGTALPVRYGQILRIDTVSTGAITAHKIDLELAGISWTADQGVDSGNEWGGEVNVSTYAGGFGLHKVTGISVGPGACRGTAYVLVEGGNPLGGPVGAGAAAATGVGALAMAASAVRAGKERGPEDEVFASAAWEPPFDQVDDNANDPRQPLVTQMSGIRYPHHPKIVKMCLVTFPMAVLLTMATMATGAGAVAAPRPYSLQRVRWRPLISLVGLAGGFLMALGILLLLQQYGVVYPTLPVTIVGLVLGMLVSILIPSLVRIATVNRMNRAIASAEARLGQGGETGEEATVSWQATHTVPPEGLTATETPDPGSEVIATLEAGLGVQMVTTEGNWAQVVAENGWWGWVDARELKKLPAKRKPRTSSPARTTQREETQPTAGDTAPADWYPDPSGEARLRYWDGTEWTDHTAE
jgi:hypothetical protein